MEFKEFRSFRDYDRKFVKVTNIDDSIKKSLKIDKLIEPIIGILYIDEMCGVTLRILGNEKVELNDIGIILRADSFGKANFNVYEGNDFLKDVLMNQINQIYYDKKRNDLLSDKKLDEFRHEEYPDDVLAILPNDGQPEKMWVRLFMKTNENNIYVAELLDDSYIDKKYVKGKKVILVLYEKDNFRDLIINGFVKIID